MSTDRRDPKRREGSRPMTAPRGGPPAKRPPGRSRRGPVLLVAGLVVVVAVALVLGLALGASGHHSSTQVSAQETATVVAQMTSLPPSLFDQVGRGTAQSLPKPLTGQQPLMAEGKPEVLYIGAEYCPYCATERWAMVAALSRFGTFSGLSLTHSSTADVYPGTPTFTFHGSSFTSPYLSFVPVETTTNQPNGHGGYKALDTPTPAQQALWQQLANGGIPFIDIAGRYLINGVTYDPGVLQGMTPADIAANIADPTSDVSKGAIGAANTLVAAFCKLTGQQPSTVCTTSTVRALEAAMG
ncbi:MAG TPA: DUF929 family protein [Acidimicrobiales bacterium]|nr:DUF929 family protein [Acidimicrobiales bacterium]